jgi:hypothetical protein
MFCKNSAASAWSCECNPEALNSNISDLIDISDLSVSYINFILTMYI